MDCAARLRERHEIRPDAIVAIRCRTAAGPVPRLWEPLAAKHAPPNGYAAKFSLPYLVAVMLVKGRAGPRRVHRRRRPRSRRPARGRARRYELDPAIDYPRQFVGDVEIALADGRVVRERQDHPRGGPDAPLSRGELEAKFRGNARLALPDPRVEQLVGP